MKIHHSLTTECPADVAIILWLHTYGVLLTRGGTGSHGPALPKCLGQAASRNV